MKSFFPHGTLNGGSDAELQNSYVPVANNRYLFMIVGSLPMPFDITCMKKTKTAVLSMWGTRGEVYIIFFLILNTLPFI